MTKANRQSNLFKISRLINSSNPLITIIAAILIFTISFFLLTNCFNFNDKQYQIYQDKIIQLQQLDADFNQAVLKSRYELFTSYDPLVANLQQHQLLEQELANIPPGIQGKTKQQLDSILQEVTTSVEQKNNLSERFKSRNALLKNSLDHLPLLTNKLESELEKSTQNLNSEQLENLSNNLNKLILRLLIYSVTVDDQIQTEIESFLDNLLQLKNAYGLTPKNFPLELIASHINIILDTRRQVEDLTTKLVTPLTEKINILEDLLQNNRQQANFRSNIYRGITAVWLLLLLALLNLLLLRKLRFSHPQLSQYKHKVSRIANTLSEALETQRNYAEVKTITKIDDLVTCRGALGDLAQGVIEISNQIQQEKEASQSELSLAFLTAKLTLITKNKQKIFNSEMLFKLQVIFEVILEHHDCQLIQLQQAKDRLQLLFRYPSTIKLSQFIKETEKAAFYYFRQEFPETFQELTSDRQLWNQTNLIVSCDSDFLNNSQSDRLLSQKN